MTRLGLLLVGHVDPRSTHIAGDYPSLYQALLAPFGIEVITYDWTDGQTPSRVDECDAWLCSPSRMSTYDPVPWLADVEEFLRSLVAAERPYVGICFGHQLLAQALGGRVAKADVGWGIGVQPYTLLEQPGWACPSPPTIRLIASHQDQVVELPDDARRWLTSGYCPHAGMIVGERAWTIQTHPEFVAPLADHLYAGRVELLGADVVAAARISLHQPTDRDLVALWISRFISW